ncbi:MAG TPA: DUF1800 domain-containing protein [Candidatus Binatia bacterium]|jgi:uncharacterized protein (DUF1800 family)
MSLELTEAQKLVHVLNRTSFGATREDLDRIRRIGIRAYLDEQLHPESISDTGIDGKLSGLKSIRLSSRELIELYPTPQQAKRRAADNPAMSQAPMQPARTVVLELQQARLLRAVYSRRQLYEMMVDFWSNHFNIFAAKGADRWLATSYDRDTIRPHALGRFSDLLRATAQSPAMLFYLDNWLSASPTATLARFAPNNPRRGINENYARELMELHTLGVDGGYTQKDVQEVARCFTGWTIRQPRNEGGFYFEPRIHDAGEKTVLGQRIPAGGGMNDGLKVLEMLAQHPSTAHFISLKLARRFVSDNPPPAVVENATAAFRRTDGDIPAVLRAIFEAPEFFTAATFRAKVKKPLEYVASALRATGADVEMSHQLLRYLARMGEPLFLAQPPTGYPDAAASWASPDMILTRINFASDLVGNRIPGSRVRPELIQEKDSFARMIAPEGLSDATRSALAEAQGPQSIALLLGAPEFQRR